MIDVDPKYSLTIKLLKLSVDDLIKKFRVTSRCAKRWRNGIRNMNEQAASILFEDIKSNCSVREEFVSLAHAGNIRGLKQSFGFTSRQLADMMGTTRNTVHDIIRGRKEMNDTRKCSLLDWINRTTGVSE